MKFVWTAAAIAAGMVLYWKLYEFAFRALFRWLGARREWNDPLWSRVADQLAESARQQRVMVPVLSVLPEFSPNALVLVGPGGHRHILLSEGLVRALSTAELDAALAMCLAYSGQSSRALQCHYALALFPFACVVHKLPGWLQALLHPWIALGARVISGPAAAERSDGLAASWTSEYLVAASLQKMAVLARKMPIQRWNMALDPLYLLSPTVLDGGPIWLFPSQSSVEKRRELLLRSLSCESPATLT